MNKFNNDSGLALKRETVKAQLLKQVQDSSSVFQFLMQDNSFGCEGFLLASCDFLFPELDLIMNVESVDEDEREDDYCLFAVSFEDCTDEPRPTNFIFKESQQSLFTFVKEEIYFVNEWTVAFQIHKYQFHHEDYWYEFLDNAKTSTIYYDYSTKTFSEIHDKGMTEGFFSQLFKEGEHDTVKIPSDAYENFQYNSDFEEIFEANMEYCGVSQERVDILLEAFDVNDSLSDSESACFAIISTLIALNKD